MARRAPKQIDIPEDLSDFMKIARPVAKLREGRTDWYRIENRASDNSTDVYIYDEIGYWGTTASQFVADLGTISTPEINLHINSPGGDAFDGIAIYNTLLAHPAKVNVHVDALAASIASIIAMAGDTRTIAKNANVMIHDGHGLAIGNAADMRQMADLLDKLSQNLAATYAARAGGRTDSWRNRMKTETWYSADEAVSAGLMHSVANASAAENSWDLSIFNFSGRGEAPAPKITGAGSQWDLVTAGDPCDLCDEIAADNPHNEDEEGPPYHPNCRCETGPAGSTETNKADLSQFPPFVYDPAVFKAAIEKVAS